MLILAYIGTITCLRFGRDDGEKKNRNIRGDGEAKSPRKAGQPVFGHHTFFYYPQTLFTMFAPVVLVLSAVQLARAACLYGNCTRDACLSGESRPNSRHAW